MSKVPVALLFTATARANVHVISIETKIRGKRLFTRTLLPIAPEEGQPPLPTALEASIAFQLSTH